MFRFLLPLKIRPISSSVAASPGVAKYPQAVLNRLIDSKISIFLGVMWSRLGTPTPEAPSGTVEEFRLALRSFRANSRPSILIYRCRDKPPEGADSSQVEGLRRFFQELSAEGVFYWGVSGLKEFETSIRIHLAMELYAFMDSWNKEVTDSGAWRFSIAPGSHQSIGNEPVTPDLDSSRKFDEIIDLALSNFEEGLPSGKRIITLMNDLDDRMNGRLDLVEQAANEGDSKSVKMYLNQIGVMLKRSAKDIDYASSIYFSFFRNAVFLFDVFSEHKFVFRYSPLILRISGRPRDAHGTPTGSDAHGVYHRNCTVAGPALTV